MHIKYEWNPLLFRSIIGMTASHKVMRDKARNSSVKWHKHYALLVTKQSFYLSLRNILLLYRKKSLRRRFKTFRTYIELHNSVKYTPKIYTFGISLFKIKLIFTLYVKKKYLSNLFIELSGLAFLKMTF